MNWSIMSGVIVLIGVCIVVVVECRWYQSGLVFYDILTKQMILPPTISIYRARSMTMPNIPIFSTLGKPCTCQGLECGCCAGLEVREYDFNQKICANVTYVPGQEEALLNVYLNEMSRARYGVSTRNPSPICVPIMMPIPMAACVQMTQVGLKGDNLHMCMDFVMRLHTTDAMELHFNCMSMGLDGFQYLDPNGNAVFPPRMEDTDDNDDDDEENTITDEYYDTTEDDGHDNDEESEDYHNNAIEETQTDTDYYEDRDDLANNEVEDESMEENQNNKANSSILKDRHKDNLIIVYETV